MQKLQNWQWEKAELPDNPAEEDATLPVIGESVVLYLRPRNADASEPWCSDIGSLDYEEEDGLVWGSAFGLFSAFDGVKFQNILRGYDAYFVAVPPLEAGRFPSPITTPVRESA